MLKSYVRSIIYIFAGTSRADRSLEVVALFRLPLTYVNCTYIHICYTEAHYELCSVLALLLTYLVSFCQNHQTALGPVGRQAARQQCHLQGIHQSTKSE